MTKTESPASNAMVTKNDGVSQIFDKSIEIRKSRSKNRNEEENPALRRSRYASGHQSVYKVAGRSESEFERIINAIAKRD